MTFSLIGFKFFVFSLFEVAAGESGTDSSSPSSTFILEEMVVEPPATVIKI